MAKSRYEELLNMAHSATNGAGAAFSRDEQGNTYVDTYTGNGQERKQVAFTPDKPVEERHSKYEELLNMAYHATGGEGAAFSRDEQGNVYVTPWEATKKRTEETQAAKTGGVYKQEDMSTVDKAVDSLLGVDRTQVTGEKTNWWQLLKGTVSKGLNQWNSLNWKSANFLFGDLAEDLHALGTETVNGVIEALNYIPGVNLKYIGQDSKNLVEWGNEDAQAGLQQATEKYAANANSSRAAQIVDKFGTSTVAAVPMALEAILLAPAQAAQAGAATTAGLQYFSGLQSAAGMEAAGMMAKEGLTKLVQNPQFWTSYLQVAGDGYESALEDGMSEEDAGLYGLVNGFFNAMVEIGGADEALGGIQNLPMRLQQQGGKHAVVEWFKDAVLGEASEEVIQGLTERGLLQGMQGDSVQDMFSLDPTNTRAAFNPWTAAQEAIGGGVVGAVLGGGQTAINKAVTGGMNAAADAITTRQEQREQAAQETGRQYVQQVITNMDVSEAEQQILTDGLQTGNADPQTYAQGIQEAFRLGEMGLSYEQAVDNSTLGDQLNEAQFRHAWEIGARKGGHSTEAQNLSTTRPVNVPEYESIEEFSRDFKSPERVTEIFDSVPETDVNEFAAGFRAAYDMGQSGVSANYLTEANVPTLTTEQAQAAYQLGRQDAEALAVDRDLRTAQRQRTGGNQARVRGSVRGDGVSIADLKRTFNDSQNTAYRLLTRYADTTGVNIVLYNSQADQTTGLFPAAQGRFQWKDDTIYVDINSGLFSTNDVNGLGNYTMLRTFAHEFTHFIEKWNSAQYNEFREFVFQTMEARGQNVHDMIEAKQALDESGNMTYEQASREVVADAMMDILPDSSLVQQLASEHPNVFRTLLKKLREFAARMKQYYKGLSGRITEAETLKQNGAYLEDIVQMWDNIAKGAVQNYQGANGEILVDQPAKPENLPKRTTRVQENSKSNPSQAQPETRRAGMDFFRPVETTEEAAPNLRQMAAQRNRPASMDFFREVEVNEEEAPNLAQMAAQRNQPVTRDRFPANDFTSQAEAAPDLKGMVPRAQEAPSEAQETQAAEEEPETPAATETPAAEETGASEAAEEAGSAPTVAEVLEEAAESEKPVEPVPPKAETEKAKERLKKGVSVPVEKANKDAIEHGLVTRQLSLDNITLSGVVRGFNVEQRAHLIDELIRAYYNGDRSAKISVPYDGKFTLDASLNNVVDVLSMLKAKVTQDVIFNKKLDALLKKNSPRILKLGDEWFISATGMELIPITQEAADFATTGTKAGGYGATVTSLSGGMEQIVSSDYTRLTQPPVEVTYSNKSVYYRFPTDGNPIYAAKTAFGYFDGGRLYGTEFTVHKLSGDQNTFQSIKVENPDGTVAGYLLGGKINPNLKEVQTLPANLKSFSKKAMQEAAIPNTSKERTDNGRHDGTATERKAGNDNARLDEGSEGVRSGDTGRETAQNTPELQEPAGGLQERGNGRENGLREPAENDRGTEPERNGRNDSNGDSGRLQNGSNASRPVRENGKPRPEFQGTVPIKQNGKQNARNYRIDTDIDSVRPNFQDNLNAIKLVKQLIEENRAATDEERAVLAKYKGWGGLKNYILDRNGYYARQLQNVLTPEEYEAARDSVLNAHYTSTKVISGIYKAVQRMGFKGGNILEPSMGVGNFFGMLPQSLSKKSSLYGVELDKITGTIAKNLYPDARIDVAGFQDILYGDGTFDLVVGNVPFSNDIKIPYRGSKYNLHDFFFVKALDEMREGGVLALITSTGTLDKLSGKTQKAIADRANLIAAFRLPDNAFLANAGTSVTTDLIFLQKKGPNVTDNGVRFTGIGKIGNIPINEYYVDHPENVLGELAYETGMYASERTVVHATSDFEQRFNKAIDSLPKNIMNVSESGGSNVAVKKRGERARATFEVTNKGAALIDAEGNRTELSAKQSEVVKKYVEIKNRYFSTSEAEQSGNIEAAADFRSKLNESYDAFTKKYGTLEKNKRLLGKDDEFLRVSGLEIVDKEGNVSKSAIFERPTMYRERKTSASTSSEGLSIVLNETGRVDVDEIAKITGKTVDDVIDDLTDEIILTPDGDYVLIPQYLSGNIYQKLDAVQGKKGFERQEQLLKTALPKPKTAQNIDAEISSHWIPPKYINEFIKDQFQPYGKLESKYIKELGRWELQKFYSPIKKWSTSRVDAYDLLIATLNNKRIKVTDTNSDGTKTLNEAETKIAQNKQNDLRSAFREWVFKDGGRRAELESIFNRTLNAYAPMNFDALAEKLDYGIDPSSRIQLRDYQKSAVARIVFGGNTLLHHGVGTGKTATMIAAAHTLKSTGIAHKPMFVVPNGKTLDFKREILGMYPGANVLALDADLLTPKELKRTKALIATNDWDYIIIHKTGFQKIGVSPETTAAFIEQQLEDLENAIREGNISERSGTRFEKSLITKKKNLEEQLKKILEAPRDDSSTFENMGVDALFVDEAHNFKKVGFATTQQVSGVDSDTNGITTDLYMKENWLRERGGRIVLATATPITNTVSEMYNMTLHVNPDILREAGVYAFDGWLNTFGDLRSDLEIASDGKTFRMKERIQDFKNGNELISLYRQFADVKQTKDVVRDLPEAEEVTVLCKGSDFHQTLLDSFTARMSNRKESMLNVNNDARAAATDLRMVHFLVEEMFPGTSIEDLDLPDSKINKAVGYIVDEYRKSEKNKGTQIVFLDSGMGRGNAKRYTFNLYGDLIAKLVKSGIPRNEIADIGDYDGDEAKQKLYDLVNAGTVRVLIGSTAKMGEGVNVQNKMVALHDLSVPMRADNLEQRHGRIIRHGNENKNVRIYKYIQEQSYDSYLWQMIERKSKYMAQALNGGDASDLEEIAAVTVNAQQSKALATGNPAIMEKFKLEDEVNTLRTLEKSFFAETAEARRTAVKYRAHVADYQAKVKALEEIQDVLSKNQKDDFEITVGNNTFDTRKDGAAALFVEYIKDGAADLGRIYGLDISKYTRTDSNQTGVVLNGNPDTFIEFGDSPEGNITRLLNGLNRVGESIAFFKRNISSSEKTIADAEKTAARKTFPQAEELSAKLARLEEINEELGIKTDDVEFGVTAEGEVEESIRRQTGLSNREVLSMAADELGSDSLSEAERNALQIFRDNLTRLEEEQDNRQRLGREYKDQQFTKGGSRQEADRIRAAMSVSDSKIKALENRLLSLENKEVLKGVLEKARRVVELEERKRGDENLKRYRERRNESMATRKYRERVRREVETLREWLMRPSNKDQRAHVPAEIQKTVADFIESINFMSKTALRTSGLETTKADERYLKNLRKMRDAIKANVDTQGYSGYADLPEGFVDTFNALITKAEQHIGDSSGVFVVNQMSAAELQQLAQTIRTLRKYIVTMNSFHNNAMFQHAYEAGEDTVQHLSKFQKSKKSGTAYKFMRFDYMRPSYAFEHFGKGGQSIEHEFREGQATQAFLANRIIDFAKKTYTGKEVEKWSKETKTFTTTDGETVTMPITHLMSLYCLNKRPQALTHIYGDGIRVANYKNGKQVELDEGHIVTIEDVQQMIQELTPRQREVADALQKYMSTETATWGNYVSLARFDVEQFTEENYFPINSDGRYLSTTADESPDNAGLYALLNSSFTKELKENADNRIILYNIFDVFANHTASMTQYRSFALPVLDALKWFNYKNDTTSVRTKLSSAFGAPLDERAGSGAKGYAEQFVINLLKAYNGTSAQGDPYDSLPLKMLHHFNGAAIAYNLRVIIQQPTAVTRAAMILSPAKLMKGLSMSAVQMRKLADEMEQHSGIAAWKALGFYDTNISRGLTDLIKQNPGVMDRVMEVGTKGAEAADRFTWAAMWYAAKDTVKRSDYRTEEEYFKAVTDLFEEVIYKTQVVDSLLTKAEFLRSKGGIARQMGSFMSEPSATMSMLTDAYFKYTDDLQQGMGRSEAWKRNGGNIAKTAAVYAVGQVILSAMQAVIDAWRDQDDKDPDWLKNYLQKYLAAFKSNVVEEELIFGKIPLVSELYELMKNYLDKFGVFDKLGLDIYGNDTASGLAMYTKYLTKAVEIIAGKVTGDSKYQNYTNYGIVYNLIRAAANLSGVPFATAWREVQDLWNNTVGFFNPRMKMETYRRKVDQTYIDSIQQTGLAKASYEKILDEADKVHGDGNGSIKQDELGAALVAALEEGTITEEQAQAVWETKGWKKTFDGWRGLGSDTKTETPAASTAGTSTASKRVAFTPTAAPAATSAPATAGARSYDDFKKVPVYDSTAKQAMYGIWETQLQSSMSLDRFMEILTTADTDGNDSLKQDEMGVALMTSLQSGELTFDQCDAIWRTQWNKARSKTFAKWLNG